MSKLLMIGTGPVAIQLANICYLKSDYEIDMVGRASTSEKSKRLYQAYKKKNNLKSKYKTRRINIWKVSLKLIVCIKILKTLRANTKRLSWHAQQMLIMTHYSNCR